MKRFNPNTAPTSPEELPRNAVERELIAFHLGELSPERERALRHALELDPALQAESNAFAQALAAIRDTPMTMTTAILDRNWHALRPSLSAYPAPAPALPRWRFHLLTVAALAGVAGLWWLTGPHRTLPTPAYHRAIPGQGANGPMLSPSPSRPDGKLGTSPGLPRFARKPRSMRTASLAPGEPPAESATSSGSPTPSVVASVTPGSLPPVMPPPSTFGEAPPSQGAAVTPPLTQSAAPTAVGKKLTKLRSAKQTKSWPASDLMLGLGANVTGAHRTLIANTGPSALTASASPSVSLAFHQQFRPALGYRATLSFTKPDYTYTYQDSITNPTYTASGRSRTGILEMAGTYVLQGPHAKRLTTAADVGAGVMTFIPLGSNSTASYRYSPAAVLGASADYALNSRWAVRLSYRAQVFHTPEFEYYNGNIPVTRQIVVGHEPSIGVTYRWGGR